jgi:uncharacterized protein YpuA (DUF1002 family)
MTRKDYEAIASDIKHAHERWIDANEQELAKKVLRAFLDNFNEYLKDDNDRFNEDKFMKACGLS